MAAWLHHGNDLPQELNCLTSLGRSTSHIGNKTKLSSLSIDRQLKFKITAWPKLGNKAAVNGNKSIKCTGSYFTAVKASSLLPLLRHVVSLNDGNCRLTMPVGKGRCARDALPHAFHFGVFKFVFTISTAIKHIYKESANIIEGCNVACDTNDCWNFQ